MKNAILSTLTFFIFGCISGPKLDSKLKYLNGSNYGDKKVILGIPVAKTKKDQKKK